MQTTEHTPITGNKGGSSSPHTPYEQPDDLLSAAKLKMLLAVCEGEVAGDITPQQIYLNDTPLANDDGSYNFTGVKFEFRKGTQDQDYIQGMPEVNNELSVGQAVTDKSPWTRQFTEPSLDAVRVKLSLPLQYRYEDDGDMVGTSTKYAVDLSVDGGSYKTVVDGNFTGKTTSEYQRDHRIDLPKGRDTCAIRVRRITADSTDTKLVNGFKVFSFAEVIDSKLRYPMTTLLYIEVDSAQFSNGAPKITVRMKGKVIRVPDNYDPVTRTYSGSWSGNFKMAYSDNPAWVFYDLLLDKIHGMGNRVTLAMVDKWWLYQIAAYCDEKVSDGAGGTEPRFTCNAYIQSQEEAFTVMQDFAAIFRGITYWGNSQIIVNADIPADDIEWVYTAANVSDGLFSYAGGSYKNRYTSCLVSYSDPANHYTDTIEAVYDADLVKRYDVQQMSLSAIGCTSQSEAHRRGRWALLSNAKDGSVSFNVGLDGHIPLPASIIGVADPYRAGKQNGGRISAVNGLKVTLDRPVDFGAGDRLIINLPDGTAQTRTISAISGDRRTVSVSSAYKIAPVAGATWIIDSDNLAVQQFRVTSVSDNGDGSFTVSGVQHDPDKYQYIDDGIRIQPPPVTVTPTSVVPSPKNILISENSHVVQGISVTAMQVAWDRVDGAVNYSAQWRRDDGNWVSMPVISAAGFEVQNIYTGRYLVRVMATNPAGISSPWAYSSEVQLTGKTGNPPKPIGFIASENVVFGIELNWGFPENTGDTLKTEIQYSATGKAEDAILLADVPYPQKTYQQMGLKPGQVFFYRAQLVDKTGNQSGYTDFIRGEASIDVSDITDAVLEEAKKSEALKSIVESVIDGSAKIEDLAAALRENADGLAAAVGSNKQTAESIISNSLAIADVVVRQSVQNGVNSARYEELREVVATETEARVTDVKRLDAATSENTASLTEVRQTLTTETEARTTAVSELTAKTQQTSSDVTDLTQTVSTLDSAMSSRLEEIKAQTDNASGSSRNIAITSITQTLAQVNLRKTLSAQYGANNANIDRIDNVMTDASQSVAESIKAMDANSAAGNANSTDFAKVMADFSKTSATKINSLTLETGEQAVLISDTSKAVVNLDGKISASKVIKVAANSAGKDYIAGIALGVNNDTGVMQSEIIMVADNFYMMSLVNGKLIAPFIVKNGQVIMNDVLIGDGTINRGKITDELNSDNYVQGKTGIGMNFKTGKAEFSDVVVRGTGYFTDGDFEGTVRAGKIIGDITSSGVMPSKTGSGQITSSSVTLTSSIIYKGGFDYDMYISIPSVQLTLNANAPNEDRATVANVKIVIDGVSVLNSRISVLHNEVNSAAGGSLIKANKKDIKIVVEVNALMPVNGGTLTLFSTPVFAFKANASQFTQ